MNSIDISFMDKLDKFNDDSVNDNKIDLIYSLTNLYQNISNELKMAYNANLKFVPSKYDIYFPNKIKKNDKNVILVSHEMTRTGAPLVLKDLASVLIDKGYNVIVFSPAYGKLVEEYNNMGCIVIIQMDLLKGRYDDEIVLQESEIRLLANMISYSDFSVFCTLVLHNIIKFFIDTEYEIYWWLHEGSISFEQCYKLLPEKLSDNIHVLSVCEYVAKRFDQFNLNNYKGDILNYMVEDIDNYIRKESNSDKVNFICVGTIDYRKGQDLLLKAIEILPFDYLKRTTFTFVGSKHNPRIVEKLEKMTRMYDNISYQYDLTREDVFALYEKMHCIIAPSRDDPMPVVLTENMIIGNICMCSDHTGTADYIESGENGFVFQSENYIQIADQIKYITDYISELKNMGIKSRKIYEEHFTKERFVENVTRLILDV